MAGGCTFLFLCDGGKADCPKTHCKFNGTGECEHTADAGNARACDAPTYFALYELADDGHLAYVERTGR